MAVEIDDRWLNVQFENCPEFMFGDRGVACCALFTEFEAVEPLMTWSEIDVFIEFLESNPEGAMEYLARRVYNQKKEGSCVGNAIVQSLEMTLVEMFGKDRVPELSAMSLYKQIGRSADSGAMVSDGYEAVRDVGVLPLDTPANRAVYEHVFPATGFSTRYPEGWNRTSANFRGAEFLIIRSVQAMFTALCRGHIVIVGRNGHSIAYIVPMRDSRGRRIIKYLNSWSMNWGAAGGTLSGGFGFDSESVFKKSAGWAFAIRVAHEPKLLLPKAA